MLLAISFLIICAAFGTTVLAYLKLGGEKMLLLLAGTLTGLTIGISSVYALTILAPFTALTITVALLALAALTILMLTTTAAPAYWRSLRWDRTTLLVWASLVIFSLIITPKLIYLSEQGIETGILNAYGDVAWHVSNITLFASGTTWPPENPIFADTRLTYPFLTDFFSAILVVGGLPLTLSVTLPALILLPLFFTLWYGLVWQITHRRAAAVLATGLFLLSGGTLGFLRFFPDWHASGQSLLEFITHLPAADYTGFSGDPNGFHFLNPILSLLLPQRAFLFGFPLAVTIIYWLVDAIRHPRLTTYLLAGILAGLLPLFHAHTVLALLPAIVILFFLSPSRHWLGFLGGALLGLPEVMYYLRGIHGTEQFLRWAPGWTAGSISPVWFWLKNTGLILPITLIGLFIPGPRLVKMLAMAGLILFVVGNLWLFAPWAWDNIKILTYWFLWSLPLVSLVVVTAWDTMTKPWRTIVILAVAVHILAPSLDLFKLMLPTNPHWVEWDVAALTAADTIRRHTQPGDTLLTAPVHNSVAALTGRPVYLGHPAHVWSHGGSPWTRDSAIPLFYQGQASVLPETSPTYIVVGPQERILYPAVVIQPSWQRVATAGPYQLFRFVPETLSRQ